VRCSICRCEIPHKHRPGHCHVKLIPGRGPDWSSGSCCGCRHLPLPAQPHLQEPSGLGGHHSVGIGSLEPQKAWPAFPMPALLHPSVLGRNPKTPYAAPVPYIGPMILQAASASACSTRWRSRCSARPPNVFYSGSPNPGGTSVTEAPPWRQSSSATSPKSAHVSYSSFRKRLNVYMLMPERRAVSYIVQPFKIAWLAAFRLLPLRRGRPIFFIRSAMLPP
jgi:hypothetical protein